MSRIWIGVSFGRMAASLAKEQIDLEKDRMPSPIVGDFA